jgi:hypothetical protein
MDILKAAGVGVLGFLGGLVLFILLENGLLYALLVGIACAIGYYFSTQKKSRSDP